MKITTLLAIAVVVGMNARAGKAEGMAEQSVTAYLENDAGVPSPVLCHARALAAKMFAAVGEDRLALGPAGELSIVTRGGDRRPFDYHYS